MAPKTKTPPASAVSIAEAALKKGDGAALHEMLQHYQQQKNELIKRAVIERRRTDILAREVLGLEVSPHHLAMMTHQAKNPQSLNLVFRGAGKTTTCTITKAIELLCRDRNVRILIASKSTGNAESFLKEIKAHLMGNEKLIEIFGPFYDGKTNGKWDNREIEVIGRTLKAKEANITVVGVDGTVVSKHYDVILSDDLVDEDNSRTQHMRQKVVTWYFQTLLPTLEPPHADFPDRGQHHHSGTRYHYADLWGYLMEGALKGKEQIIPALSEDGLSCWPEKWSKEHFETIRTNAGTIIFNAQYQCNTEAMKGEIFQIDDCQPIDSSQVPSNLKIYQGVDLAIGEKEINDKFAHVTVGHDPKTDNFYVLDFWEGQLRFTEQSKLIIEKYDQWKPIRCNVESIAYQAAQVRTLNDLYPEKRIKGADVREDKITRAQKLSALFEAGKVFFVKGGKMHQLIEQLVLMPAGVHEDGFDALDLAIRAARTKVRKTRREPGIM